MKIWCSKNTQREANSDELQAQLKQDYLSNLYDEIYLRSQITSNTNQAPCVGLLIIKPDLTYHQINYLLGIVHPVLAKKSYCDCFTSLHSSNQKCVPFFFCSPRRESRSLFLLGSLLFPSPSHRAGPFAQASLRSLMCFRKEKPHSVHHSQSAFQYHVSGWNHVVAATPHPTPAPGSLCYLATRVVR